MLSEASGGVLLLVLHVACWNSARGRCICNAQNCLCVPCRRKIVTSDGTIMEPVDFEKAGDRATTRNWQLSICVTGGGHLPAAGCGCHSAGATLLLADGPAAAPRAQLQS